MNCNCEGWKKSMPQIENAQVMHGMSGVKYTGDEFKYCPWCGVKLKGFISHEEWVDMTQKCVHDGDCIMQTHGRGCDSCLANK